MSITDVLIRSFSGYIFLLPGILIYLLYLKKSGRKQTPLHTAGIFVFCYYLVGVLTMTGIGKLKPFSPELVLVPFRDMITGPVDTALNVVLFVPLGLFLPLLYSRFNRVGRVALTGFLFSLSIEIVQMFGRGSTDVNDLITNTIGTVLGYFIYKLLFSPSRREFHKKFKAESKNDILEVAFLIIYSFIIMVTLQPILISSLFNLG